jgi:hypothetical protein
MEEDYPIQVWLIRDSPLTKSKLTILFFDDKEESFLAKLCVNSQSDQIVRLRLSAVTA